MVGSPSSFSGVRILSICLSGNDDFPLAKVECLQGDGTLIERAREKSIPYKDMDKKKLTPLEDGQKE